MNHILEMCDKEQIKNKANNTPKKQHQFHNSLSSCQYWYTSVPVTTAQQQQQRRMFHLMNIHIMVLKKAHIFT